MRKTNNGGKGVMISCFLLAFNCLIPAVCRSDDASLISIPQIHQYDLLSENHLTVKNETANFRETNNPSESDSSLTDPDNETSVQNKGWLHLLWGTPSKDYLYLGMWTYHIESLGQSDSYTVSNDLIGGCYQGIYGGTFRNSHGDRTYTLGLQRTFSEKQYKSLDIEFGYRAGMMYGYRKSLRLFDTPFFPLLQVVTDIAYKNVGIELSWAGVVLTAGFFYKF